MLYIRDFYSPWDCLALFSLLTRKMFASFPLSVFSPLPDIFKGKKGAGGHDFRSARNVELRYYHQGKCHNAYLRQIASITVNLRSNFYF